ncbi:MAG: hypothetical protein EAX86_11755 [Candidatus Heimdallarchaeota archaeon]|nr:hypothetical protein [Candidatus Heimdallarchaeota archaeon]
MGLRNIEDKLSREAEMKRKGAELAIKSLEEMSKKVQNLHRDLEKLENKFEADFKKNPELAQHLMSIREELGLPLSIGLYEVGPKPSFKDRLTGKDEFHNYLALRILEIGNKLRTKTGGIVSASELILRINEENKGITIGISDLMKSLDLLKQNGMIHSIREYSGLRVIEFIDPNLSDDHHKLLEIGARFRGEISLTDLIRESGWSLERINQSINSLINQKIAVKSETLDGIIISFPGL